jgi:ABC-type sugar transport system ATPase subunit
VAQNGSVERPLVELRNVSKSFGPTRALDGVSLDLLPGEVHVIAGENGAGKSTLIRILSGAITDYEGEIRIDGALVRLRDPQDAARAKIATIHQELSLVAALSVTDNLLLGQRGALFGRLDSGARRAQARAWLQAVDLDVDPDVSVEELSLSQRQLVEIARALGQRARVLVMDEPTSALSEPEAELLFARIARLCEQGTGVIYITHRMEEIYRLAGRISVLRDGRHIVTASPTELPAADLVASMVGRDVGRRDPGGDERQHERRHEGLLRVRSLKLALGAEPLAFDVARGEVLGLAGLQGSGNSALLHALSGARPCRLEDGVEIDGKRYAVREPSHAVARGVVLLSADRAESTFGHLSVRHNATLSSLGRFSRGPVVLGDAERREVLRVADQVRLRSAGLDEEALSLSGGNQQKVALMRCLLAQPRLLLLDEPTRGIDVGAKEDVYALIARLRDQGVGILLVASEMDELIRLSDRIVVLFKGAITGRFAERPFDRERILRAAMSPHEEVA